MVSPLRMDPKEDNSFPKLCFQSPSTIGVFVPSHVQSHESAHNTGVPQGLEGFDLAAPFMHQHGFQANCHLGPVLEHLNGVLLAMVEIPEAPNPFQF